MPSQTIILVGLGNPGAQYNYTRHNVGFLAIDEIAKHYNAGSFSIKFKSQYTQLSLNKYKIILIKPLTYMNNSGIALIQILNFFKLDLRNVIVIHDDIDLQFLHLKYKISGGSGGHNGLKSIDQHCGINYGRLRIGVGRPEYKDEVSSYVLHKFNNNELDKLLQLLHQIALNINFLLDKSTNIFINKINNNK